ncbi:MAG: SOS response-associated peptidase [Bacteroidales bacterium]
MCGRYSFAPELKIVNEHYDVSAGPQEVAPNYNCAPTQMLPVIANATPGELCRYRWGLIPFWAKDPSIGNRLINARGETVASKPAFKNAFKGRRCLVPADAFYEWLKPAEGKLKIPFRIVLKDQQVFSMAGIWEEWKDPDGLPVRSFSIITTTPNELMAEIHDRMPVILPAESEEAWLHSTDETELQDMLKPYPAGLMEAYRISSKVNSPRNNSPEIIEPV